MKGTFINLQFPDNINYYKAKLHHYKKEEEEKKYL